MSNDSNDHVTISRLTAATAIDILRDVETELEQSNATGPYLEEVSETIDTVERALETS